MPEHVRVRTQDELDRALQRDGVVPICLGSGYFHVGGSATVWALDSATVVCALDETGLRGLVCRLNAALGRMGGG